MTDIEAQIKQQAEKAVLKFIGDGGNWIKPGYHNRLQLPADFMAQVWGLVDTDKIQQQLARRVESELADRVMNHLASEMATDVKSILSVRERREALRAVARENLDRICNPSETEAK